MNLAETYTDAFPQKSFPQQIQTVVEQMNNLFQELEEAEANAEEQLDMQLRLRKRNVPMLTQQKKELEKMIIEKLEALRAATNALERHRVDGLIRIDEVDANRIAVVLSRFRQLIAGKQTSYGQLIIKIQKAILSSQQVEENEQTTKLSQQEQQRLLQVDMELARHEDDLEKDQKEITSIHRDVNEIVTLIDTISTEVVLQGEKVTKIEDRVLTADQDMDEGLDDLLHAQKVQKKGNKLKCWLTIIACIAVAGVVIVLLFTL